MPGQLVPETRLERFLSSIVYNTDVPEERRNRIERWLGAILKRNPPPDAPYDRLERWLKEIYENADYTAQFSGPNVEFWSPGNEQIKSLVVDIKPYQDFNGYDKPWAPGTGKNLIPFPYLPPRESLLDFWSSDSKGIIYANGMRTAAPAWNIAQFTFRAGVRYLLNGSPVSADCFVRVHGPGETDYTIQRASRNGNDVEVSFEEDTPLWIDVRAPANVTFDNLEFRPMLRLASESGPTYEPYVNACPIIGFDEVTVKRYGYTESDSPLTVNVSLGQIVYGGYLDVITGNLTITHGNISSYDGETITGEWLSSLDLYYPDTDPTEGAQVVYELDSPISAQLSPNQITTLLDTNHVKASLVNGTTVIEADITLKL